LSATATSSRLPSMRVCEINLSYYPRRAVGMLGRDDYWYDHTLLLIAIEWIVEPFADY
jgi:hypothetical protein